MELTNSSEAIAELMIMTPSSQTCSKSFRSTKRETVLLYYFFDMSEREIAKFCNLSRTTVQSRRTSSMKLLKRYLEEKAYDCTD